MEDASGEDLDWFWRGWFYSTDVVDISLDSVKYARADVNAAIPSALNTQTGLVEVPQPMRTPFEDISTMRNREDKDIEFQTDIDTTLRDFYWRYARGLERYDTTKYVYTKPAEVEKVDAATAQDLAAKHFYQLSFSNKGELVMPIIIEWTYSDGTKEIERIPAQVWRHNEEVVTKTFMKDKPVTGIRVDPLKETADINETNNNWGAVPQTASRFQVFKAKQNSSRGQSTGINPMQKAKEKTGY
jgi:hypothetical protein